MDFLSSRSFMRFCIILSWSSDWFSSITNLNWELLVGELKNSRTFEFMWSNLGLTLYRVEEKKGLKKTDFGGISVPFVSMVRFLKFFVW